MKQRWNTLSILTWAFSGVFSIIGGTAVMLAGRPHGLFDGTAHPIFMAVVAIGIVNVALAVERSRFWFASLPLNALGGLLIGFLTPPSFAAFPIVIVVVFLGSALSALAFCILLLETKCVSNGAADVES